MASRNRGLALALTAILAAGCTVHKTEAPALQGPSELALSLSMAATPDTLTQDGSSQSQVVISARDANAQPVKALGVRVDIAVDGVVQDFGRLSAKDVVTGNDGKATVIYTAPPAVDTVDRQTLVTIMATPSGSDATGDTARKITIKLVPQGVITPPGGTAPVFTVSPDAPLVGQDVNFVAAQDNNVATYAWDFGDGGTGSGRVAQHQYRQAGDVVVTLNTTSVTGVKGTRSRSFSVLPALVPTVNFTYSPADPAVNTEVFFNASVSSPSPGRTLVTYTWDFGDGSRGSGVTATHRYTKVGTYLVTLTATDDVGASASISIGILINSTGTGGLVARFTYSPMSPTPGSSVNFNATSSTTADPIVRYDWEWGDGSRPTTGNDPTVSHTFSAAGSYVVTLTISDSKGSTAQISQTISVITGS